MSADKEHLLYHAHRCLEQADQTVGFAFLVRHRFFKLLMKLSVIFLWHMVPFRASTMRFLRIPFGSSMVSSFLSLIHIWHLMGFLRLYLAWISTLKITYTLLDILGGFANFVVACL